MVTLANSTIRVIVRELGGPEPIKTYDIVADFGATGDGTTDDGPAFTAFQTAHAATGGRFRLYLPAGEYKFSTPATDARWTQGFENLHVLGETPAGGVWGTTIDEVFYPVGQAAIPQTNRYSARFEPAAAGAYTITIKDDDVSSQGRTLAQIMALFEVGKWVFLSEYDTQGNGYPQNPIFSEYHQIASKTANTITFTTPLTRAFSDTAPEFSRGSHPFNPDHGGPATIYAILEDAFESNGTIENIQFTNPSAAVATGGNTFRMKNCKTTGAFWPSTAKSIIVEGGTYGSIEVDKLLDYLEFDGATLNSGINFQSSQPAETVIRNSTVSVIAGTPRNITIEDTTITGTLALGPSAYGYALQATLDNVTFSTATIEGANRTYSLAGCTFTGGTIKGYVMQLADTPTGTPVAGETLTGASSSETGIVRAYEASLRLINLESVSGTFTDGETVTTTSMTAATVSGGNKFGQRWAGPGCRFYAGDSNVAAQVVGEVLDYYREGDLLCVETDVASWPSYTDAAINQIRINPCPALTVTNCTGNEQAVAWSTAPGAFAYGGYYYQTLSAGGVLTPAQPIFFGKLVSLTVNVTRAYTGTQPALYWAMNALVGIRLDGLGGGYFTATNPPRFTVMVDLKTTGTRVFSPSGNSGILGSDIEDSNGYHFIFAGTSYGTLRNGSGTVAISGESSGVWPEFTVTMITEV